MKKIGSALLALPVRLAYFFWMLLNRILYPPRIVYPSKEVKRMIKHIPCILIANHTDHADGYYIPQMMPRRKLYTYVTRKWYDKPKLHWLFVHLKYIPVDLKELDTEWLEHGKKILTGGGSVLIFPEGKLNPVGTLGEFQPGALMLARAADVPVIPLAIPGEYRRFRRKTIYVGEPISLKLHERGRLGVILRRESAVCRETIAAMLGIDLATLDATDTSPITQGEALPSTEAPAPREEATPVGIQTDKQN